MLNVTGDLAAFFSDFAVSATYQAMVNGAPSGAPFACDLLDATDGQFASVGHVPAAEYNRLFYLRADQAAAPVEADAITVGANTLGVPPGTYTISAAPRYSDATRSIWVVPVR